MSAHGRVAQWLAAACVGLAGVALPLDAAAQVWVGGDVPRKGSVEVSAGALWSGPQDLPGRDATLTGNPGTGNNSVELFSSDPTVKAAIGVQATIGFYVTRALSIEGGVRYARPQISVRLSDDFEGAPDVTATTTLTNYVFTGSLLMHFGGEGRVRPFVAAGAGHLRDVHEGNELVETGTEYHGKVGVKMWFGSGRSRMGLRAEGGVAVLDGGFSFEEATRRFAPIASVGLSYVF